MKMNNGKQKKRKKGPEYGWKIIAIILIFIGLVLFEMSYDYAYLVTRLNLHRLIPALQNWAESDYEAILFNCAIIALGCGAIIIVTLWGSKKKACPICAAKNDIKATTCKQCGMVFPEIKATTKISNE